MPIAILMASGQAGRLGGTEGRIRNSGANYPDESLKIETKPPRGSVAGHILHTANDTSGEAIWAEVLR